ncbi:NAD-dependent epimerase/dehydratase family protein [Mucilaginibacter corticis]|uniref:NAD-dependent epimerase/dehydratase family protein n=1 Tax=Mucilaginibacter corticis TaxID=2597670 RepID=A0A556MTB2_9SPHI|nr:NAD-dependent epimerase/dehydratase family protein [Mucilaginibacter corticis]TSJ43117.1 NAD-dependent epimerase/dehydratase family protein [Mucilaginibacter corticis]
MKIKVIITGATGMVGEGVLLHCLDNPDVEQVLIVNRKHYDRQHPKLKELLVPDFMDLTKVTNQLKGYDACFFCAGVTSVGKKEPEYTHLTYDVTLSFAQTVAGLNPDMVFTYVSGSSTDSTEQGSTMWARVKGRTENALFKLPFKKAYAFRPGIMKPVDAQQSLKGTYRWFIWLYPVVHFFAPKSTLTLNEVGQAMINCVTKGYAKSVLEIEDIRELAKD